MGHQRGGISPEMLLPAHHCITTPMNKMTSPTDPVISWDRRAADSSQPRLFCHAAVSISDYFPSYLPLCEHCSACSPCLFPLIL